jgi:hypothetical protein
VQNTERLVLLSEVLDEALDGPVSQKELLILADTIARYGSSEFTEEYDRPLNLNNPNFYSLPVDRALDNFGFSIAKVEQANNTDRVLVGVDCPKRQFNEFCTLVA